MFEFIIQCKECSQRNRIIFDDSLPGNPLCAKCHSVLGQATNIKGYVYILTNESMPGLIKVGFTCRSIEDRVKELDGTNLPTPFQIEAYFSSSLPQLDENLCHESIDQHRIKSKEFFIINPQEGIAIMEQALGRKCSWKKEVSSQQENQ